MLRIYDSFSIQKTFFYNVRDSMVFIHKILDSSLHGRFLFQLLYVVWYLDHDVWVILNGENWSVVARSKVLPYFADHLFTYFTLEITNILSNLTNINHMIYIIIIKNKEQTMDYDSILSAGVQI